MPQNDSWYRSKHHSSDLTLVHYEIHIPSCGVRYIFQSKLSRSVALACCSPNPTWTYTGIFPDYLKILKHSAIVNILTFDLSDRNILCPLLHSANPHLPLSANTRVYFSGKLPRSDLHPALSQPSSRKDYGLSPGSQHHILS